MKKLALMFAFVVAPIGVLPAQANLSFSGGAGTPLTMSLFTPISYTVTVPGVPVYFVFGKVGDFNLFLESISSMLSFSVNGGESVAVEFAVTGAVSSDVSSTDLLLYSKTGTQPLVNMGDVVTLQGSFTTTSSVAAAPPSDGLYQTFIVNGFGSRISADGLPATTVPEPSTYALLASGLALLGMVTVRRKRLG